MVEAREIINLFKYLLYMDAILKHTHVWLYVCMCVYVCVGHESRKETKSRKEGI